MLRSYFIFLSAAFLVGCKDATPNVGEMRFGQSITQRTKLERSISHDSPYGYSIVNNFARRGINSERYEIRHGDCGGDTGWNDCTHDRQRIERKETPQNVFQRPGDATWYGWSIYLPDSFEDLGAAPTTLGQVKLNNWRNQIWDFGTKNGVLRFWISGRHACNIGRLSDYRGRWLDITIFADYSLDPSGPTLVAYVDGKQVCAHTAPLITSAMLEQSNGNMFFKYGVYSAFVSHWLNQHKTHPVNPEPLIDETARTDGGRNRNQSPAHTPFNYNWGVELPTRVVFYDEMRFGRTRAQVDVAMIEAAGGPPVD